MRPIRDERRRLQSGFAEATETTSDQRQGFPAPPIEKPAAPDTLRIPLPPWSDHILATTDIVQCMRQRRSGRRFSDAPLSLEELSFLLWATQGVDRIVAEGKATLRTVPSGGARHPFETYIAAHRVTSLDAGVYRYLPLEHALIHECCRNDMGEALTEAALGQAFVGGCAATFIWTAVPYRCEWRYPTEAAKLILQDSGHLCQNLYLACEAIGCRTCAIGAYDQAAMDAFLQVDGDDELVVYLAPVGHI